MYAVCCVLSVSARLSVRLFVGPSQPALRLNAVPATTYFSFTVSPQALLFHPAHLWPCRLLRLGVDRPSLFDLRPAPLQSSADMLHGYRSAYAQQTSSPKRSRTPRTPRTPASPSRQGSTTEGSSEASSPTNAAAAASSGATRPRSTTLPSNARSGETANSTAMPPPAPRRADASQSATVTAATPSASSASSIHPLLQISTCSGIQPSSSLLPAIPASAGDEQPSSARSDSAALWQARAVSAADKAAGLTAAGERAVSASQPASPAKVRGRSLLLQTLPAQLFFPAPPLQPAAAAAARAAQATLASTSAAESSSPARTLRSSTAATPSGTSSPSRWSGAASTLSAAPPAVALSVPPSSAAAVSLSPEKLNLSPGLTHIIALRNRRKEEENERRRRKEEETEAAEQSHFLFLHGAEQARGALTMEQLMQPRLDALRAERSERKEAHDECAAEEPLTPPSHTQHGAEGGTEGGAIEGASRDAGHSADEQQANGAVSVAAGGQRSEADSSSSADALSLPVLLGSVLLLGAGAYASWMWYQRQKRRLGVRR